MKRILLLDHPQFTSSTYFLWHGLKELESLYPDSIAATCYPYIPSHYDARPFDLASMGWYQELEKIVAHSKRHGTGLPYGVPPFQADETITSQGDLTMRPGYLWLRTFPKVDVVENEEEMVRQLNAGRFDLVVLGNSHRVPTILLGRLKERVKKFPPVVYLDAGERDELNEHWIHVFRPEVVFKQILTPEVRAKGLTTKIPGYTLKMYPLPLSSQIVGQDLDMCGLKVEWLRKSEESLLASSKFLQVFYSMGITWPEREGVVRALDDLCARKALPVIKGPNCVNYHYLLSRTRMAVTMRGSGRDTTRYWEIPLYKTAMVADGTMGCIHPYPFEDGKTALFYRSTEQLIQIIERNIDVHGEVERVALAGQAHLEKYHSTAARAVFFLGILDQELSFLDGTLRGSIAHWRAQKGWDDRPWEGAVV